MRNITTLSPDSTQALFTAGARKMLLVAEEAERASLREQFRERLSELEFFALPDATRMQNLIKEITALSSNKPPIEVLDDDANGDAAEVFDLSPLSRQRVTVKVGKREPARFYFVDEDDVPEDNVEEDRHVA